MHTYQGNDFLIPTTVKDSSGSAVDLTGSTLSYQLSKRGDETALISLSDGSGVTITDAAAGECEVTLSDSDTAIAPGTYEHELLIEISSGEKYSIEYEDLTIRDSLFTSD